MLKMDFSACSEAHYCQIDMGTDSTDILVKALLKRLFRLSHTWMHFPWGVGWGWGVRQRQCDRESKTGRYFSCNLSQTWQRDGDLTIKFLQVLGNLRNKFCLLMLSLCWASASKRWEKIHTGKWDLMNSLTMGNALVRVYVLNSRKTSDWNSCLYGVSAAW